ncbi:hypothetical protein M422DRAFT_245456 [Sphaerobolus stellatus SS14]|nr:hypothetical protein M422DRAFT_245456 [Sphaerobolus stellatus SS14]
MFSSPITWLQFHPPYCHFNDNVPDPPKTLCIIQSALVDGVVPMQETATILILRSEVAFKDIVLS